MAFLALFSIPIAWVGCGDDHSTAPTEPPPPITRFQLCDSAAFSPGWVVSYELTGKDSGNYRYSGIWSEQTGLPDTLSSPPGTCLCHHLLLRITEESSGITLSGVTTTSLNSSGMALQYATDIGPLAFPWQFGEMPDSASIGEFGDLDTWLMHHGGPMTGRWNLVRVSDTTAEITQVFSEYDSTGILLRVVTLSHIIESDGRPQSAGVHYWWRELNGSLELDGSRPATRPTPQQLSPPGTITDRGTISGRPATLVIGAEPQIARPIGRCPRRLSSLAVPRAHTLDPAGHQAHNCSSLGGSAESAQPCLAQ